MASGHRKSFTGGRQVMDYTDTPPSQGRKKKAGLGPALMPASIPAPGAYPAATSSLSPSSA